MPSSINGIGTYWYGHALEDDDGSYVVTEWITVVWIPLIPLGSKRVSPAPPDDKPWWKQDIGSKYWVKPEPLHWPHIFKGYAVTLGIVLFFWYADRKR